MAQGLFLSGLALLSKPAIGCIIRPMGTIGRVISGLFMVCLLAIRVCYWLCKGMMISAKWLGKAVYNLCGIRSVTLGSARFASFKDINRHGLFKSNGLILGTVGGRIVRAPEDDHLLVIAPTKSGKTSCFVNTNLLELKNASAVVTDPNGESWAITRRQRAQEGQIFLWAPFSPVSDMFNPLDFVRIGTPHERDDAELIANLIVPDGSNVSEAFWDRQARDVLVGIILYVLYSRAPEKQTMAELRHLITLGEEAFNQLLEAMIFCGHPLIRRCANMLQSQESKLRSNVMATVQSLTRIWDSPLLTKVTSASNFRFGDLRAHTGTVYLVVPPDNLPTYYPAVALLTGVALAEINRAKPLNAKRVVFMLDEFANLGRLKPVETAISIARKAGIQLCLFMQDIAQAHRVYGKDWQSFESNCRTKVLFGVNQVEEAKKLSETIGVHTVKTRSAGHIHGLTDVMPGQLNAGTGEAARSLKTPDELLTMDNRHCVVLQQGVRPILAEKLYFKDKMFNGRYDIWDGKQPYENIELFIRQERPDLSYGKTLTLPPARQLPCQDDEIIELSDDKSEAA